MFRRRSEILDQVVIMNTSAPIIDFEHGSHTEVHESHFCTYEKEEVLNSNGKYFCAECGSTSLALKLDADEHGVDLYCEPCWIIYYGETFDGIPRKQVKPASPSQPNLYPVEQENNRSFPAQHIGVR